MSRGRDDTKAAAKTIDLCNNPMTKEPKLLGAARIVREWPSLDREVRAFTDEVERRIYGEARAETPQERAARLAAENAAAKGEDTVPQEVTDGDVANRDEL